MRTKLKMSEVWRLLEDGYDVECLECGWRWRVTVDGQLRVLMPTEDNWLAASCVSRGHHPWPVMDTSNLTAKEADWLIKHDDSVVVHDLDAVYIPLRGRDGGLEEWSARRRAWYPMFGGIACESGRYSKLRYRVVPDPSNPELEPKPRSVVAGLADHNYVEAQAVRKLEKRIRALEGKE